MPVVMIGMNRFVDRQQREARAKRYAIAFHDPAACPGLRQALEQACFDL